MTPARPFLALLLGFSLHCVPASHALEASASNDATVLSTVDIKADVFKSIMDTALAALVARIDTCSKAGRLYAPTSPSKDANGCVGIPASCSFPSAATCGNGSRPVSNGANWVCG